MVKFQFFGLFLAFFGLFSIHSSPALGTPTHGIIMEEQCNLPAPDSFRITQAGGDFIKLAWKPIFPGATHQLTIMESDGAGGYVTILEENHVPGDTYIAEDLLPGTGYRFVLATKCPSGDPSEVKTIIDGITLIVDLMVNGRTPVNPKQTGDCEFIPAELGWAGFNIFTLDGGFFSNNYFEVKRQSQQTINGNSQDRIQVLRRNLSGNIFAVNDQGFWPDCNFLKYSIIGTRFRVERKLETGGIEIIGYVNVAFNSLPPSFKICPDYSDPVYPWKSNFTFQPIVAQKIGDAELCPGDRYNNEKNLELNNLKFENPFTSNLKIWNSDSSPESTIKSIQIYNSIGNLVISHSINDFGGFMEIPTNKLNDGVYFVQTRTNDGFQMVKLTKITK